MKKTAFQTIVIVVVALLLTAPAILSQEMTHDSFWINLVWSDQFTSELSKGNLYPRWLPLSHLGLGSPVFYYYPPLAFYLISLFALFGLPTYTSIIAAGFIGFIAAGLGMYAWLRDGAKAPLLGALLFMAAPYHVLDFYSRGAIAEFVAIAFIPILALAVRRAAEGRLTLCALAYAGLILTHLPLALLVSLFLVAPYGLYLSRHKPSHIFRIAVPLSLGLAMAAIYLVPAIALDPYRDSAVLWNVDWFKPESWTLLYWGAATPPIRAKLIFGIIILALLQAAIVLLFSAQRRWGVYALLYLVMAGALIPVLWQLPLLRAVQFPFRMLPLAAFAIATGFAYLSLPRPIVIAAIFPFVALSVVFSLGERARTAPAMPQKVITQHADVPENLPPGDRPTTWPSHWALEVARSHPGKSRIGDRTVEPIFYFPAWEVRCQGKLVPTSPDPDTKLLTYKGTDCERRLVTTMPERIGTAISLAGLLALLGLAAFGRRRSIRTNVNDPNLVGIESAPVR